MFTFAVPSARSALLAALLFAATSSTATVSGSQSPLSDAAFMEGALSRFDYREIGPTRQGGRVVTFGVSAPNPKTFYVGAGPGGVWKTVNNGTSFEPVFEDGNTTSIGDIAVATSDEDIVWIGTGEANIRNSTYYGDGVYKSVDGGRSWAHMGLPESHHIGRVLIHFTDPDVVYVAAQGHLYSENPERGVYKTTDGGATWEKSLEVVVDGVYVGATEVVMSPDDPEVLFAAAYQRFRRPWSFSGAGPGSGIYRSGDGGDSWERLANGLPGGMLGKIGLAIYPRDPRIIYARVENANSPDVPEETRRLELAAGKPPSGDVYGTEVYRSDDGGDSWRKMSAEGANIGGRDNYYGQIIVDPNDADHIFILSTRVDESFDAGRTWTRAFRYAGDNHVLWIDPDDSDHMLLGYDYGMAITWDGGDTWYHPDELPMAQLYAVGYDMDFPYNVYGGMQDFGSWKGPSTKKGRFPIRFEDWEHMNGGDGFYNRVDPTDSRWLYSESQFGDLRLIDQSTGQRRNIGYRGEQELRHNWNSPFLLSPHDSNVIYHGANVVLRSSFRGADWQIISPDLSNAEADKIEGVGAVQYATTTALDESPIVEGLLWAGTDDGNVWLTRNGGDDDWSLLNANVPDNPAHWVSRLEASNHDPGTAYLTYTGFHFDDFRPYVYKTTDYGQTWVSIAANLPDRSVNVIVEDAHNSDLLFVGTDGGVYATLDGGTSWWPMRNDMPVVPVHDLAIHPRENDLIVGTFGRGFFLTDISPLQELSVEAATSDAFLFSMKPVVQWVMPSQPAVSAQNFEGENAPHAVVVSYMLGQPSNDATIRIYDGSRLINEISGPGAVGLNRVEWYMTARRPRTEEELARWDRQQRFLAEDEEFFDYYDTVEYFLRAGEEVDKWGRSLRTRVHGGPGLTDRDSFYTRVVPGEYVVELDVGGRTLRRTVTILQDHWYDR